MKPAKGQFDHKNRSSPEFGPPRRHAGIPGIRDKSHTPDPHGIPVPIDSMQGNVRTIYTLFKILFAGLNNQRMTPLRPDK